MFQTVQQVVGVVSVRSPLPSVLHVSMATYLCPQTSSRRPQAPLPSADYTAPGSKQPQSLLHLLLWVWSLRITDSVVLEPSTQTPVRLLSGQACPVPCLHLPSTCHLFISKYMCARPSVGWPQEDNRQMVAKSWMSCISRHPQRRLADVFRLQGHYVGTHVVFCVCV